MLEEEGARFLHIRVHLSFMTEVTPTIRHLRMRTGSIYGFRPWGA